MANCPKYPIWFFILISIQAHAQEWKNYYDEAVKAYQQEQYVTALSSAEKSFAKVSDHREKAYTLQLITTLCIETQQLGKGSDIIGEELRLFEELEGKESKQYAEALNKQITFLESGNHLDSALHQIAALLPIVEKNFGTSHCEYGQLLLRQGNILVQQANYQAARNPLEKSLSSLTSSCKSSEHYLIALFLSGITDANLRAFDSAEKKLLEYVKLAEANNLKNTIEYNEAKSVLQKILSPSAKSNTIAGDEGISVTEQAQYFLKAGHSHQQAHRLDSALKYYDLAKRIILENALENNTAFSTFINVANVLILKKDLQEAEVKLQKARQLAMKLYGAESLEWSYIYKAEGDVLLTRGLTIQAEEKYLLACKTMHTLSASSKAQMTESIAQKLFNAGRFKVSLKIMQTLAEDSLLINALRESERIEIITLYATLLQQTRNKLAVDYLEKQIQDFENSDAVFALQILLATILEDNGRTSEAENTLLRIRNNTLVSLGIQADAASQLARLQQHQGNYHDAEQNYLFAIKNFETRTERHQGLLLACNSLATLYITLGNYDAAEDLYLSLMKQADVQSEFYSVLRQNLATIYEQTLRYDEARQLLEETLERDKTFLGIYHPDYAITLQNLAALYQKTGKLSMAKDLFTQAIEIDKKNASENTLAFASKTVNIGTVYQGLGELEKAKSSFEVALNIYKNKVGEAHPDYVFTLYNLAVLLQRQKNYHDAHPMFNTVSKFYIHQINDLFPALSEIEKTAFCNKINPIINGCQDFAIEYRNSKKEIAGDLYNLRLFTKALLLNSAASMRSRIINSGNTSLLSTFAEWQRIKERLAKLYTLDLDERMHQLSVIETLKIKANDLEKFLSEQSEEFASDVDKGKITWENIKQALKPGEAAVEMIRLKLNQKNDSIIYAALILRFDSEMPSLCVFPNGKKMETREFTNYKNCITFQVRDARSYDIFWKPIEASLKDIQTIYFSPDGIFNKINLLTLFNEESEQYLIDRMNIRLLSNTKDILDRNTDPFSGTEATLVGFPNYGLASTNISSTSNAEHLRTFKDNELQNGIPDLPGTKEEVLKIKEILNSQQWKVNILLGDQATEENIKSQRSPAILHIATHGFFIESVNDNSPIMLSKDISDTEKNPLLRSGLMLAGAQQHFYPRPGAGNSGKMEDGILTALEAMNLNLDKTALVVLSACETGSGQIRNGEGVFGLQRAFLVSGAKSVLMSLWKVNDQTTQELMVEFYKRWMESKDKAEAFRKTQLMIKEKYKDPVYWGNFVMMGI